MAALSSVLIAEDDPISARILDRKLKEWGYSTILARDGREAWTALQNSGARLALLDWMMPGASGPELCRRVRNLDRNGYIYIVLLTARDDAQDIVAGLEAGADDYMVKPVHFLELKARLQTGSRIIALEDKLIESQKNLHELASRDSLTALWNRKTVLQFLGEQIEHGCRQSTPTSVIMIDVDHFKKVNDSHGHQMGDRVLKEITASFVDCVRSYDRVGRYGGDEFIIVLPDCGLKQAGLIAHRLRAAAAARAIGIQGSGNIRATISLGCSSTEGYHKPTSDRLIRASDRALLRAKRAGRDRVELSAGPRTTKPGGRRIRRGQKTT